MDVLRILREQITALEERVRQYVRNQIQVSTVSRSTALGNDDGATGLPDTEQAYQRSPRRFQHFGFRSRPPKNTATLLLLVGGGQSAAVTAAEYDDTYGPSDLADGEMAIYSKASGAYIKIDQSGKVTITASTSQPVQIQAGAGANVTIDAGTGGSVKVNGGGRQVAAQGDTAGPYPLTVTGLFFERS